MPKSASDLEARMASVEKDLAQLKSAIAAPNGKPWYRQIVGDFAGDRAYAEIIRLGRRIRRGRLKG